MQHSEPRSTRTATDLSRSHSVPEADSSITTESAIGEQLAAYTRDPFSGFWDGKTMEDVLAATPLLDIPNARRWFDLMQTGLPQALYTYQLPLQQASGPESAALGTPLLMFSSYSYLGLIGHPRIASAV